MNPWNLSASDILIWGIVLHLIADWPLQNNWMANNKTQRWSRWVLKTDVVSRKVEYTYWWIRHPAAYVHAGIHGIFLSLIFGWAAIPLAVAHLLIDTRVPVMWWGTKMFKTPMPQGDLVETTSPDRTRLVYKPVYDLGLEVLFWRDQVFHIVCIAVAALLVA